MTDKTGKTNFRPDFQFPDKMIIIEADGYYTHFTPEGLKRMELRDAELREAGWKIIRFKHTEIERNFEDVKLKILTLLSGNT